MIHAAPVTARAGSPRWVQTLLLMFVALFTLASCGSGGGGNGGGGGGGGVGPLTIVVAPQNRTVNDGGSAALGVVATSSEPITYQWERDGVAIPGATLLGYVTPPLSLADSGHQYTVVVKSGGAEVRTPPATVTVLAVAPTVTTQPQSQTVVVGQAPTFAVAVQGSAPLSYQWQRDNVAIAGATAATYTAPAATLGDSGARYRVVVSNVAGPATSADAVLTVTATGQGPTFSVNLAPIYVASPGQGVRLEARVVGTPPFLYQWFRNGVAVTTPGGAGSTASADLSLETPVTAADEGVRYAVRVTTAAEGAATSTDALISVVTASRVSAGGAHTLARLADGTVRAWGDNTYGQLGRGNTTPSTIPVEVTGLTGVSAVATGADHSLALKGGEVWAWGRNAAGALGDGTQTDRPVPQRVGTLTGIVAVAAGEGRSFAVGGDGSLWAWGENLGGALGVGDQNHKLVPTRAGVGVQGFIEIRQVAAGARHTLALNSGGEVFLSGEFSGATQALPVRVTGLAGVAGIAAGDGFSIALDVNGALWSWGANGSGQLGLGDTAPRTTPTRVQVATTLRIDAGNDFALARLQDGSVLAWGAGASGQLGTTPAVDALLVPAAIPGLAEMRDVTAGRAHALAVRSDGSAYAWGANASGQLGLGTTEAKRDAPVQILGLGLN